MSCYNPMIAVKTGHVNPESKKPEYKFLGSVKKMQDYLRSIDSEYDLEEHIRETGDLFIPCTSDAPDAVFKSRYHWEFNGKTFYGKKYIRPAKVLPCGQCLGCRTAYAASWADRIMLEAQRYENVYFLTLTYDEDHVPRTRSKFDEIVWHYDPSTDTFWYEKHGDEEVLTLVPDDLQAFLKRLRDQQAYHHGNTIRFYAVGEYGATYHRPHYHLIIFGLILDDVRLDHKNKNGRDIHTSDTIFKLWHEKGMVEVEELTWELAAYAARYCVKKLGKKETGFYEDMNLQPEFTRMSLKPAIGFDYFDEHKEEIYKNDEIIIPMATGSRTVKPPRYFDDKYDDIYPAQMEAIKGNRESVAKEHIKLKLASFSGSYLELLYNEELAFKNRTKSLRRMLE